MKTAHTCLKQNCIRVNRQLVYTYMSVYLENINGCTIGSLWMFHDDYNYNH